jgi:hypothetical protein
MLLRWVRGAGRRAALVAAAAGLVLEMAPSALATSGWAGPPPLSADRSQVDVASTYGSGSFGNWGVDADGLPVYHYTADELTDPNAAQAELAGGTRAQHQVGNDNIKGMSFNHGYTQLWDQDQLAQWANLYQATDRHYAGGYGYLNLDGKVASTLYLDHQPNQPFGRDFGIGYYTKRTALSGITISEDTTAPFGNDPVLLDDVTLTNTTSHTQAMSWFEYWDVNPYDQPTGTTRGLMSPTWAAHSRTLAVAQFGNDPRDLHPLSIFAAALNGPAPTWDTSVAAFFGAGTRAVPAEVAADRLSGTVARPNAPGASGDTLFVFDDHLRVPAGGKVTLRYVYGMAQPQAIEGLVAKYRASPDAEAQSEAEWASYLPKADFGGSYTWVARELEWDAYLLRSATVYEAACGEHTITQGGYYQYQNGLNLGTRSWPHYELPMVYSDPNLARQILIYTAQLQPAGLAQNAQLPYGTGPFCERIDLGTSSDLDFWLLNAAAEYGLATRDLSFFDTQVHYYDTSLTATLWHHLEVSFEHMQTYLAPNGEYLMGTTGDWNDFSTEFEQMTESTLITAQLAYAYPRLAELARLRGDTSFADALAAAGAKDLATLRAQWTGNGWYSRGYRGPVQVGTGAIFETPQPWAILAGAPTASQAATLVANIHRYLDGYGAPGGPSKIGTALVPAADDPGVTEHEVPPVGTVLPGGHNPWQGADQWPGGVWFDPNGWLTWAYSSLDGTVAGAVTDAWDEYLANTLARHAATWPEHWAGTISVDDVCNAFYSSAPDECGNGLTTAYDGQITEQPTWMVMDAIRLAGITPVGDGYDITPHLPMTTFSLRLPQVGVARTSSELRGYVTTESASTLVMHVSIPPDGHGQVQAFAGGRPVASQVVGDLVTFDLVTSAGQPADWAVTA